jgi:hypothetical protein
MKKAVRQLLSDFVSAFLFVAVYALSGNLVAAGEGVKGTLRGVPCYPDLFTSSGRIISLFGRINSLFGHLGNSAGFSSK